jgi:probable HAF family extracellular repeat protein
MALSSLIRRIRMRCLAMLLLAGGSIWMPSAAARTLPMQPPTQQTPDHVVYLPLLRALHGYSLIDLGQTEPFTRPDNNTPSLSEPTPDGAVAITLKRDGRYHSYRWQNSSSVELALPSGFTDSTVVGINQIGQIVGFATAPNDGNTIQDAMLWDATGQVTDLGSGRANGINNTAAIILRTTNGAAVWRNRRATQLTTPNTYSDSWPAAINNADQIVGWATLRQTPADHAALWERTGQFRDLGTLGGASSGASDINDAGVIVGSSNIISDSYQRAFIWQAGVMSQLATPAPYLASAANSINNARQIVGYVQNADFSFSAALWQNQTLTILNQQIDPGSGWQVENAMSINDAGQIVGFAHLRGELHLVLLTPVS